VGEVEEGWGEVGVYFAPPGEQHIGEPIGQGSKWLV